MSVLLFLYQSGKRTQIYFQYKTNVDIKKVVQPEVEFPAVTICNQNNYRYYQPSSAISSGFVRTERNDFGNCKNWGHDIENCENWEHDLGNCENWGHDLGNGFTIFSGWNLT